MTYEQMAENIKELCGRPSVEYYNFLDARGQNPSTVEYVYKMMLERELHSVLKELARIQKKVDKAKQLLAELDDDKTEEGWRAVMFYKRFQELCVEKGVTQNRVQCDLGLSHSTGTMWKKRGTLPTYVNLKKLAQYFGVSVDYLVGDSDSRRFSI